MTSAEQIQGRAERTDGASLPARVLLVAAEGPRARHAGALLGAPPPSSPPASVSSVSMVSMVPPEALASLSAGGVAADVVVLVAEADAAQSVVAAIHQLRALSPSPAGARGGIIAVLDGAAPQRLCVDAMKAGADEVLCGDEIERLPEAVAASALEGRRGAAGAGRPEDILIANRFRALVAQSRDGVAVTAHDGRLLYLNRAARRVLGVEQSARVGAGEAEPPLFAIDFIAPEERARMQDIVAAVRASPGRPVDSELRTIAGRIVAARSVNLIDDPDVQGVVTHLRDVTDKREAANALARSEARLARLIDANIIGVVVADMTGKALEANQAYLEMLGYSSDDLARGEVMWRGPTPLDAERVARLRETGIVPPYERELYRKDGSVVTVLVALSTLDSGTCIGVVVDLSERRRIQRALEEKEQQFRQAQKMEAVGRLAGGIAHDFNNILSIVLSFADLVLDTLDRADSRWDDVNEIRKAGARAADLVKQLLIFSRHQVFDARIIDLNETLAGMKRMIPRMVGEDVRVVTALAPDLQRIKADANAIEQVVMNLVVNARDAMPAGGTLTLETTNVHLDEVYARSHLGTTPGPHVMLAVSDTGVGMDRATQARLFEPFFTTKERGKGTGLGLSTVFGIVQQVGGSIWVYSEPGRGSTFKVFFPVAAAGDPLHAEPAHTAAAAVGSERVLLVEDEDGVRGVARAVLKRSGFTVIEARNGVEALALYDEAGGAVDIVCTDVVMPRMGGRELAEALWKKDPSVRILFMSGYTDDTMVTQGVLDSSLDFLQKPFSPAALTRRIREILDRK